MCTAKKVGPICSRTYTRVSGQLYLSCITPGQHTADNIHISHMGLQNVFWNRITHGFMFEICYLLTSTEIWPINPL